MNTSTSAPNSDLSITAIKLLGDMLEDKEAELISAGDDRIDALNELWGLYGRQFLGLNAH
jgi:hypothetical protein